MDWSANAAESAALEAWSAGPVRADVAMLIVLRRKLAFSSGKAQKILG